MLRMILGIALGFACGYLMGSERAREEAYRRFSNAPEPVRQVTDRISGAMGGTSTSRVNDAVQVASDRAAQLSEQLPEVP